MVIQSIYINSSLESIFVHFSKIQAEQNNQDGVAMVWDSNYVNIKKFNYIHFLVWKLIIVQYKH